MLFHRSLFILFAERALALTHCRITFTRCVFRVRNIFELVHTFPLIINRFAATERREEMNGPMNGRHNFSFQFGCSTGTIHQSTVCYSYFFCFRPEPFDRRKATKWRILRCRFAINGFIFLSSSSSSNTIGAIQVPFIIIYHICGAPALSPAASILNSCLASWISASLFAIPFRFHQTTRLCSENANA